VHYNYEEVKNSQVLLAKVDMLSPLRRFTFRVDDKNKEEERLSLDIPWRILKDQSNETDPNNLQKSVILVFYETHTACSLCIGNLFDLNAEEVATLQRR
jgi:hypothetical protein